jgi:hypothetical protein
MQVRRQLARSQQQVVAGGEPLLDPFCLVTRGPKQARELDRVGQIRGRGIGARTDR